jgi:hypothetical protein
MRIADSTNLIKLPFERGGGAFALTFATKLRYEDNSNKNTRWTALATEWKHRGSER